MDPVPGSPSTVKSPTKTKIKRNVKTRACSKLNARLNSVGENDNEDTPVDTVSSQTSSGASFRFQDIEEPLILNERLSPVPLDALNLSASLRIDDLKIHKSSETEGDGHQPSSGDPSISTEKPEPILSGNKSPRLSCSPPQHSFLTPRSSQLQRRRLPSVRARGSLHSNISRSNHSASSMPSLVSMHQASAHTQTGESSERTCISDVSTHGSFYDSSFTDESLDSEHSYSRSVSLTHLDSNHNEYTMPLRAESQSIPEARQLKLPAGAREGMWKDILSPPRTRVSPKVSGIQTSRWESAVPAPSVVRPPMAPRGHDSMSSQSFQSPSVLTGRPLASNQNDCLRMLAGEKEDTFPVMAVRLPSVSSLHSSNEISSHESLPSYSSYSSSLVGSLTSSVTNSSFLGK